MIVRIVLTTLFLILLAFGIVFLATSAQASGGGKCFSTEETGASLYINILENGFIKGDICVDDCGCGSILGEAHIADLRGTRYGTLDFFADLPESCAFGIWYSVDLPSHSYIWFSTALDSTQSSGTGKFKEIPCLP